MKKIFHILVPLLLLTGCQQDTYVARVTDVRLVSVDPKYGYPGDLVTVLGRNFSAEPLENIVTVGGERARVLEAYKDRLLIILLPERFKLREPLMRRIPDRSVVIVFRNAVHQLNVIQLPHQPPPHDRRTVGLGKCPHKPFVSHLQERQAARFRVSRFICNS